MGKAVRASSPKTDIKADNASNPLILRYDAGSKPLTSFLKTNVGRSVKKSKRVDSLSEKWAEMGKDQRKRYFEVFELARLEYDERTKREPKMATKAQARAKKITKAINVEGRPTIPRISAYTSFMAEQLSLSQGAHSPRITADTMKAIYEKWSNLSPAEKKPYEAKVEKAKATYFKMKFDAWESSDLIKRPKKPLTSYIIFVKEQIPLTPADKCKDRMKVIAEKWTNLSHAEKKPYEAKAEKAQATYKIELDAWKRSQKV